MKTISLAENDFFALPIPSACALDLAPELPLLALLEAAAIYAARALAAAHPQIAAPEHGHITPEQAPIFPSASAGTAAGIIAHLDALRFGIGSYQRSRNRELSDIASVPTRDYPF